MKLSKEQIDVLDRDLSHPYGSGVELLCDGYTVTLKVERCKGMRYRVMTYVNGYFKGIWCGLSKQDYPERRNQGAALLRLPLDCRVGQLFTTEI